ncbi:MAG: 50S ribosomal protein L24 [archaeon]
MVKKLFTTAWKESKQPRKQRKYLHNLPLHLKQKLMAATLDKDLRKKYGMRNIEVRKGDEVVVMRGKFKKRVGKIVEVDLKNTKIALENMQNTKRDGNKVNVWFHPSKVKIKILNTEDKMRLATKQTEKKENAQDKK